MKNIINELACKFKSSNITGSCKSSHNFTTDNVSSTIYRLKPHKSHEIEDILSEIMIIGYI